MPDPDVAAVEDVTEDVTTRPAMADEIVDVLASEPVICDPVIGFVCPQSAMKRG